MVLKKRAFVVPVLRNPSIEHTTYQRAKSGEYGITAEKIRGTHGVYEKKGQLVLDVKKMNRAQFNELFIFNQMAVHPVTFIRANAERLALIRQLKSLGFHVAVPDYGGEHVSPNAISRAKKVSHVFKAKITETDAYWARDLWVKFFGGRLKSFTKNGLRQFADAGQIVPLNERVAFLSSALRNFGETKYLLSKGHRIYFLKRYPATLANASRFSNATVAAVTNHIDLFIGAVGKTVLVDMGFYNYNRSAIDSAVRENKLSLVFIPKGEAFIRPANFLPIGENRALVDMRAKKTISLLRDSGVEIVPTKVSLRANMALGGGVRCIVNEL